MISTSDSISATGPDGLGAGHPRLSASRRSIPPPAAQRSDRFARSVGAAGAAALHKSVAQEFLHRYSVLSPWLVPDEVQPARVQFAGDARRFPHAASVRAGIAEPGISRLHARSA